ncbi:MarR family winged helix-turn-helix transcriptional regulator [Kocuria rhizophila]|uniref:MarR family winged helix-turn-helix transcriptional regulator n=1 Tax=Kocuria rhizophila TaxID=72000 RepID=UPI00190A611E|nr:MarR family transcriptional regulator [Kocuria rhizophila]MBK4121020.1 MarR family transcriptional regulator [Kocuria rhizophila]
MDTSRASAPDVDRTRLLESAARLREVLRHGVYFLRSMEGSRQITSQQISLLTMLRPGGVRMTMIAANLGVRTPTATQGVDRLSRAGLVRRDPDPTDARAVLVSLTPAGEEVLAREDERRNGFVADVLSTLDAREVAALDAALPVLAKLATGDGGAVTGTAGTSRQ